MYDKVREKLEESLKFAMESREEYGLDNPSQVKIMPFWRRESFCTDVKYDQQIIGYNIFMILQDGIRHLEKDHKRLKKRARIAFREKETRESVAEDIVSKWNEIYKEDKSKSITTSTIFHSLERMIFRQQVPIKDEEIIERFVEEAIGNFIRDTTFRNMDIQTSESIVRRKFSGYLMDYSSRAGKNLEPEKYEWLYHLISRLAELSKNPGEMEEKYKEWNSIKDI